MGDRGKSLVSYCCWGVHVWLAQYGGKKDSRRETSSGKPGTDRWLPGVQAIWYHLVGVIFFICIRKHQKLHR